MIWLWWALGLTISTLLATWFVRSKSEYGYSVLLATLTCYVIGANVLVPRLVEADIFSVAMVVVPTGSILWPFTAQLLDMISQSYGRQRAFISIAIAYSINLIFVSFIWLASTDTLRPVWDVAREQFWIDYFQPSPRILLASLVTAVVCMSVDVYVFDWLRRKFSSIEESSSLKRLAGLATLRALTSDALNMLLDGVLFSILAFAFVLPLDKLIEVAFGSVALKLVLVILDKPWFIAYRVWTRR